MGTLYLMSELFGPIEITDTTKLRAHKTGTYVLQTRQNDYPTWATLAWDRYGMAAYISVRTDAVPNKYKAMALLIL